MPDAAELLYLWHTYRLPVLLAAVAVFALVRLTLRARGKREKTATIPPPGSPGPLSKDVKDGGWPDVLGDSREGKDEVVSVSEQPPTRAKAGPKRVTGVIRTKTSPSRDAGFDLTRDELQPLLFFSSLSGTTEKAASKLVADLQASTEAAPNVLPPKLLDLAYIDYDDYFIAPPKTSSEKRSIKYFYLIAIPTYNIDTVLDNFLEHLRETHHDFRIDTAPLSALLGYSVFGFGNKEGWPTEAEGFCSQAKEADKWMAKLTGRKRAFPLGMGDVNGDAAERFDEWGMGVEDVIRDISAGRGLGEGVPGSGDAVESDEEDVEDAQDSEGDTQAQPKVQRPKKRADLGDLEDLGRSVQKDPSSAPITIDFTTYSSSKKPTPVVKEMVPKSSPTYTALTKQGYTIVGSHSGVKICRWTKSALRGRGSCYKYSFYGIKSHLCMETTPSLSCSNKCVFCWRHGTNPVGTTWRWQVDPPEAIYAGVTAGHYRKIKMMKGVPGVRAERFAEAMRIRHCALSLVGEPIFYPHINEFTALLHADRISSFLVCNAQHPDQLAALKPVTQLYVSIDASNKESLRKIDRPLHRDFWERFTRCLDILRAKRLTQRTVFRLTLVKGFNIDDEAEGYADLVARGLPCFVEVKGVTYCGTSTSAAAGLTMQNVPFYGEVCAFVDALVAALARRSLDPPYGIAAEHAHSCCVLIASTRFLKPDGWHTTIDYDRFFDCLRAGTAFAPEDYMGPPTPEWALWGNGGFDPRDERVDRKGRPKGPQSVPVGGGGGRVLEVA
ncbi:hypothetical protein B0A49_05562 [Cryomyces minteri]|uniref:tRNA 4-demethylwyosine synthase (AdoMet-dependent) n=1 Tax=Cryomyces minteri TaxID=331657 RepID=A0A4U0XEB5_9PEZI|nr:hypothetical protein B0A49_05562 [Cryomyces minteri]